MFSSIGTKLAMRKIGLNSDTFNFSPTNANADPRPKPRKLTKSARGPPGTVPGLDDQGLEDSSSKWPGWMTVKSLPLTVQPWLTPPPAPIPVAPACPALGSVAPLDRDRKLVFGGGRRVVVVFLRCVGCAFAQKSFLALRSLANRYPPNTLTCIAVSHSSPSATQKWVDLVGGAWNVTVVVDEDRAVYAAWGLGLGSVWSVLNPATQVQSWKEKGWLVATVAASITRTGTAGVGKSVLDAEREAKGSGFGGRNGTGVVGTDVVVEEAGPVTVMGNKWQETGAWAVDGYGTVVWGGKCARADEVLDLEAGVRALGL